MGLFLLTENILLTDAENLKLTVSHSHLRSVEGHWRRAKFLGQEIQMGDRLCQLYPIGYETGVVIGERLRMIGTSMPYCALQELRLRSLQL